MDRRAVGRLCLDGNRDLCGPQNEGDTYVRHDKRDWEDEGRLSLGLGLGLISLDDPRQEDDVEPYGTISVRIAIGPGNNRPGNWRGYLEPELGYWESSANPVSVGNPFTGTLSQRSGKSDLLLGLNIVGVMPFNAVDFFIGAGVGIHFIDEDLRVSTSSSNAAPVIVSSGSVSDEALGVNAHFGVDVGISRNVSLFRRRPVRHRRRQQQLARREGHCRAAPAPGGPPLGALVAGRRLA